VELCREHQGVNQMWNSRIAMHMLSLHNLPVHVTPPSHTVAFYCPYSDRAILYLHSFIFRIQKLFILCHTVYRLTMNMETYLTGVEAGCPTYE